MSHNTILIIDDEAGIRSSLQGILEDENFTVRTTASGEEGLSLLRTESFDLILLDIWLPGKNGIDILCEAKDLCPHIQVVMISGHGSVESAVRATKLGAYDYLEKPLSLEKVVLTVNNALKQSHLEAENLLLREKIEARRNLIGEHAAIKKVKEAVQTAAPSNGRVLITGENGTGKELVARLIHQQSPRRNNKFVQVNCGAIPENLIDGELFGYSSGAASETTGAKKGKILLANNGVLFLDEVAEIPLSTQARLMKVLDTGQVESAEDGEKIPFNTRIIAATDRDLKKMITRGEFREDLYYKLNVIPILLPSLRERREDIPLLIDHYLKHFADSDGKKQKKMSEEALEAFTNYSWPGNISELINVIERFVIMVKDDEIRESHLFLLVEPIESQFVSGIKPLDQARAQFEKEYIHQTLIRHNWRIKEAAVELGVEPVYLEKKIQDLRISFV
ncbi:MAG: sigma-54 dependent transcriptional regulator [Acidobacteriota bacterium]